MMPEQEPINPFKGHSMSDLVDYCGEAWTRQEVQDHLKKVYAGRLDGHGVGSYDWAESKYVLFSPALCPGDYIEVGDGIKLIINT